MKNISYIHTALLGLAVACAVISAQHFWTVYPGRLGAGTAGLTAVTIKPISEIADTVLDITEGESQLGYVKRVTDVVHLSTFNCQPTEFSLSWLERIFLWLSGSPSLFVEGILVKDRFTCGFCHQRVFLVRQALQRNGITSDLFGLNGHVVARVNIDRKQYYTDPDYGVGPFPAAADTLEEAVRSNYSLAASGDLELLVGFYNSAEDNKPYGDYIDRVFEKQAALFKKSRLVANLLAMTSVSYLLAYFFLIRRKTGYPHYGSYRIATSTDGP
ncbi:hypothetical protein [Mesorhizobium dulcispinae]|uniref:hypothetical protein n=1 Tax=Mesorhizobium dulcispinae TaxID=3072316 RepID=UPI002A23CAA1|nr:hypothetical protein [Mesorhizobium sp. VK23D]MDX8520159.1 hypothetical protein [Mesorhizobium sp. VK23D]